MLRSFSVERIEPWISLRTCATLTYFGPPVVAHAKQNTSVNKMERMIPMSHESCRWSTAMQRKTLLLQRVARCLTRRTCRATACDGSETTCDGDRARVLHVVVAAFGSADDRHFRLRVRALDELVDHLVRRVGAVMRQRELLRACTLGDDHTRARRRVSPTATHLIVVVRVHRVVDHEVGVLRELDRFGQRII